jgi:hypothetical protein
MKRNYKTRIAALATEVVGCRRFTPPVLPLYVFEGEGTSPEEIKAARRKGRAVIYVRWVELGRAEVVIDRVPDCVVWSTPQDCPMSVERLEVNLRTNEVVETYAGWLRPEPYEEDSNE